MFTRAVLTILLAIILIGAIFRFVDLPSSELFQDEGVYVFRSLGYLDFLHNSDQSTPIDWFKGGNLPLWTKLSFHDHPPLYFIIQHLSLSVFGDNLFAARLPSVLAGLMSIIVIYLIGGKLNIDAKFGLPPTSRPGSRGMRGLLAAALLAFNNIHVWISRSALMESVLILFILLNIYFLFCFLENRRRWPWFGLTLGLVILTKYTGAFLIPVYAIYFALRKRSMFGDWRLYASLGLAIILLSPVLLYNIMLFSATGHFDLQISFLFGQDVPEWKNVVGKGQYLFSDIGDNLVNMYSPIFLAVAALGFAVSLPNLFRKRPPILIVSYLSVIFITLMLIFAGAPPRFLTLYAPFFVIFAVSFIIFLFTLLPSQRVVLTVVTAAFLIYAIGLTIQSVFTPLDWGILKLERYLTETIGDERSRVTPETGNPHLDAVVEKNLIKYERGGPTTILVYDENIALPPRLWLFTRRLLYQGLPTMSVENFDQLIRAASREDLRSYSFIFVKSTENTRINPYIHYKNAEALEGSLKEQLKLSPTTIIYGHSNLPMFLVYQFSLSS